MKTRPSSLERKLRLLFLVLSGIFVTNAIIAEIVGTKIFSLEKTLGLPSAHISLFSDFVLDFNLTAGVILWPVVFIATDVINEYFGQKGVKQVSLLTAILIAYLFVVVSVIINLTPAEFWMKINSTDSDGNALNINNAFNAIFLQGLGIIIGSIVAFLIGQFLDAFVFSKLKQWTGGKKVWLRATGSTLISQLVDSFVVLFVAFYFLAPEGKAWTVDQVMSVAVINYIYKFVVAVVLTPVIYFVHFLIDTYLGSEAKYVKSEALTPS